MSAEQLKETQTYKDEQAKYGTGSDIQRGIQAATAALQGLAGGDIAGALAGASAPELANLIGHGSGLSDGAAVVAHAILGGAVAALQGNSAAAGAAGAAAGELAARAIAGMLYPGVTDLSTLTEAQKQMVSTLATVSAGMAGGLAGDSTASAVAGAQGGKNAAENNALSKKDKINIFDINPMLKIGVEDADGELLKGGGGGISKGGKPIKLEGGFYSVDGMKISQSYYDRLWYQGRSAPFLQAKEILNSNPKVTSDPRGAPGYFKYESNGLEMIYNPTTGQIGHIQPIKKK